MTLDAPLVEIGEVSATMLGSQTNPSIWRDYIEPAQKFYSWAMNNHWGTNYRAYQMGKSCFSLRTAPACRLRSGRSKPPRYWFIATTDSLNGRLPGSVAAPMLRVEPEDVLAIALKALATDAKAMLVQLFGASGMDRKAKLIWASKGAPSMSISNTSEAVGKPIDGIEVTVAGWDLVTVRARDQRLDGQRLESNAHPTVGASKMYDKVPSILVSTDRSQLPCWLVRDRPGTSQVHLKSRANCLRRMLPRCLLRRDRRADQTMSGSRTDPLDSGSLTAVGRARRPP